MSHITDKVYKVLKEICWKCPDLGYAICMRLATHNTQLLEKFQFLYLEIIEKLLKAEKYENACYYLRFLNVNQSMTAVVEKIEKIFVSIIEKEAETGVQYQIMVIESLLCNNDLFLLKKYFTIEE